MNEGGCKWRSVALTALTDGKRGQIRDRAPKPIKSLHRSVTQTNTPQWQKLPWRHTWIPFHAKRKRCSAPAHHYTKNGGQTTARPPAASRAHFLGGRHFYIGANLGSVRLARTEPFRLFFLDSWKANNELPPKGGSWTTYIVPTWSGRDIESCPSSPSRGTALVILKNSHQEVIDANPGACCCWSLLVSTQQPRPNTQPRRSAAARARSCQTVPNAPKNEEEDEWE